MNRQYILRTGSREVRGLVSPGELPDVVLTFYREASNRGAEAEFLQGGVLVASRGDAQVTLEITSTHRSIPSRLLEDELIEMMDMAFR